MNIKKRLTSNTENLRMIHTNPIILKSMSEKIISWLPSLPREYIVVCIGTDRSTGDSLGPLTGTFFSDMKPKHMTTYGTLHHPVHAQNLNDCIKKIERKHRKPFIIAVDACLGRSNSVGHIITGIGSLKPGAALNKKLPDVGDVHLTGVVNISGFMDYTVLQNTRLSIVVDMANHISTILHMIDQQLTYHHSQPVIPLPQL